MANGRKRSEVKWVERETTDREKSSSLFFATRDIIYQNNEEGVNLMPRDI